MGDDRRLSAPLLWTLFLLGAGLSACDEEQVDEPECTENRDCRLGEICVSDFCVPGCAPGASCPGGQHCESGVCVSNTDGGPDGDGDADADEDDGGPVEPSLDILSTSLSVDVSKNRAVAHIAVDRGSPRPLSLEVGDLEVLSVSSGDAGLDYRIDGGNMFVEIADGDADVPDAPISLTVDYQYQMQDRFEGAMVGGSTLTWPYHCGNLFPCHSDPSDGVAFELTVTGLGDGEVAVYAPEIPADAPAYMLAWAVGDYTHVSLGVTTAGTAIGFWHRPEEGDAFATGTAHLVEIFDWYEQNLGPYSFGTEAGVVSVSWGFGAAGGMEHHPFWHNAHALADEEVNAHEAAHGWYGNGVRLRCWEEYVLSEGAANYLEATALGAVVGPDAAAEAWESFQTRLDGAMVVADYRIAWPDSCGEVDILEDGLFSQLPDLKGAFFFRALESRVGAAELLSVLSLFYQENVGRAAGMADLLDMVTAQTGYDPTECADAWLRQEEVPDWDICPE